MTVCELEEMRVRLEERGAFDQFKMKKNAEEEGLMEMKVHQLKQAMADREKEPFLELEPATCILSEVEAKKLSYFFTKKEIDDLVHKKFPSMKTGLSIQTNLIKMCEVGQLPKIPHRTVCCLRCSIIKDLYPINLFDFWELQKKYHCEKCEKTLQPKERQITL